MRVYDLQAIGYDFDYDEYHRYFYRFSCYISHHLLLSSSLQLEDSILTDYAVILVINLSFSLFNSFVHGRLPYENLKPDPVLRSLLMSLPYRKVVSTGL